MTPVMKCWDPAPVICRLIVINHLFHVYELITESCFLIHLIYVFFPTVQHVHCCIMGNKPAVAGKNVLNVAEVSDAKDANFKLNWSFEASLM